MNIKISKSTHSCAACGVDFQHLQHVTSTVKAAEGELHREDYCKSCWQPEQKKAFYSVWSTVYHDAKVEDSAPPEVFSPLRQLFYEAAEEDSRIEMAKAFLAAGLLRRQKVFRLIKESDESDGNIRITLYTDRIGNRLIEVPDPQFSYAEMDKARTLLITRLQELETAAAAAAEGAEGGSDASGSDADSHAADEESPEGDRATVGDDESTPAAEDPSEARGALPAEREVPLPEDDEAVFTDDADTEERAETDDDVADEAESALESDMTQPQERKEVVHAEA